MGILGELTRMGIIADVVGAILIARSVFFKRNKDIFNTSGAFLGYSRPKTFDGIVAKREALAGCSFLVLGFVLQFFGSFHQSNRQLLYVDLLFAIVCAALGFTTVILISIWTNKTVDTLIANRDKSKD
jgi:hypothetical protein